MRLHYKVQENETLQYIYVIGLYPSICKYIKFPIGHPLIDVGEVCKDKEACLRTDGLIKCSILQPERLYHPVLPFICDKKLLFCLCSSCVLEHNISEQWTHTADVERTFKGTWVIDEV